MSGNEADINPVVPEWKPERQIMTASEVDDKGSYKSEGTIKLRIDRFAEFVRDGEMRVSASKYIRGLSWELATWSKETDQSNNHAGQEPSKDLIIGLICHDDSTNKGWKCQAIFSICIKAQKQGVEDIFKGDIKSTLIGKEIVTDHTPTIVRGSQLVGYETCDVLLDPNNGYIKDDTVILQAHVKPLTFKAAPEADAIKRYAKLFAPSTQYLWDFVLVIEDQEVHVQKGLLALHSEYFKDQFANHEHDKKAILQDVGYAEFIELLSVIYPILCPITAKNVETILKLAFKFNMAALLTKCESLFMENNLGFSRASALLLAQWYGLDNLTGTIIYVIEDIEDIKAMKPEYDTFSNRTKKMLFDRICSPRPASNPEPQSTDIATDRATNILQEPTSSVHCEPSGVLIVENKRIPVHKEYLAVFSEYFEKMFQGESEEKNKDEIVLEDVGYNEILELLQVIYPTTPAPITELNIEVILKMADRFVMPTILERCKNLLQTSTDIRAARKLWLAQRYNLPELQAEYAKKYKTKSDVEKLKEEPELKLFDAKTRVLILDSLVS